MDTKKLLSNIEEINKKQLTEIVGELKQDLKAEIIEELGSDSDKNHKRQVMEFARDSRIVK